MAVDSSLGDIELLERPIVVQRAWSLADVIDALVFAYGVCNASSMLG